MAKKKEGMEGKEVVKKIVDVADTMQQDIRKLKQGSYAIGGGYTGEDEDFDFKSLVGKNILIKGAAVNTYRKVLAVNVTSSLIGMKHVFFEISAIDIESIKEGYTVYLE